MTRPVTLRRLALVLVDLVVLSCAYWSAFLIRFEFALPFDMLKRAVFLWPYVVALEYGTLFALGVTRFAWRFVGLREAAQILKATAAGAALLMVSRISAGQLLETSGYFQFAIIPIGAIVMNSVLAFLGVTGIRALRRLSAEYAEQRGHFQTLGDTEPTLLIGAGQGGAMVAREILGRPDLKIRLVGFLDDDAAKAGIEIHGIRVLGTSSDLRAIAQSNDVKQAIVTIANAPGATIRSVAGECRDAGIQLKIIPGLFEIVGGTVNLNRIRPVSIEDLLRREPVALEEDASARVVANRVVMVTGAGGSIGSELCRQVCRLGPRALLLVERCENNLFEVHRELLKEYPGLDVVPLVADITDAPRIQEIFERRHVDVVLHAAAHKHVPMMEWNPGEAVKNNVLGTGLLAEVASRNAVDEFVMISTDKAVNPTSMMGATKRAAEMYIQALRAESNTKFVTVRFGNVLGSAGSVIPIFQKQIADGGPVTITHPDMRRYFMTIPEACQLVLQAAPMGVGGEIFILDMGQPVRIVDLASDLIRLSGLKEDDIEIRFTGVRPGEKLFEELSVAEEMAERTKHPKVFVGRQRSATLAEVRSWMKGLTEATESGDESRVVSALRRAVPEFDPARAATTESANALTDGVVERSRLTGQVA